MKIRKHLDKVERFSITTYNTYSKKAVYGVKGKEYVKLVPDSEVQKEIIELLNMPIKDIDKLELPKFTIGCTTIRVYKKRYGIVLDDFIGNSIVVADLKDKEFLKYSSYENRIRRNLKECNKK